MKESIHEIITTSPLSQEKKEHLLHVLETESEEVFWEAFKKTVLDTFDIIFERYKASGSATKDLIQSLDTEMVNRKAEVEVDFEKNIADAEGDFVKESQILKEYTEKISALEKEHTAKLKALVGEQ